jgi:hypothetical protein
LHGSFACHVYDGVVAAMAELTVPHLEVGHASRIVGGVGGRGGMGMPNTGQMKSKAKKMAGFEDDTSKDNSTCFISDPTRVRVKRRDVAARAVKTQH